MPLMLEDIPEEATHSHANVPPLTLCPFPVACTNPELLHAQSDIFHIPDPSGMKKRNSALPSSIHFCVTGRTVTKTCQSHDTLSKRSPPIALHYSEQTTRNIVFFWKELDFTNLKSHEANPNS